MSAEKLALAAIREAAELGLLSKLVEILRAVLDGKADQAERLARNSALAIAAKKAAKARIRGKR